MINALYNDHKSDIQVPAANFIYANDAVAIYAVKTMNSEKENTSYNKLLALLDNGEKVFIADKEVVSYSIANHDEMSNIDSYVDIINFKF